MLDGSRYSAEFPDDDPPHQPKLLLSPELLRTLVAVEKEIRQYLETSPGIAGDGDCDAIDDCDSPLDRTQQT